MQEDSSYEKTTFFSNLSVNDVLFATYIITYFVIKMVAYRLTNEKYYNIPGNLILHVVPLFQTHFRTLKRAIVLKNEIVSVVFFLVSLTYLIWI